MTKHDRKAAGIKAWQTRLQRIGAEEALQIARDHGSKGGALSGANFKHDPERAASIARKPRRKKTVHKT